MGWEVCLVKRKRECVVGTEPSEADSLLVHMQALKDECPGIRCRHKWKVREGSKCINKCHEDPTGVRHSLPTLAWNATAD